MLGADEDARQPGLGGAGVSLQVFEDDEVVFYEGGLFAEAADVFCEAGEVVLVLACEGFSGSVDLVATVEVLDGLFQANGDEEAYDDGGDMEEEVSPGGGGVVGWVDVKHVGRLAQGVSVGGCAGGGASLEWVYDAGLWKEEWGFGVGRAGRLSLRQIPTTCGRYPPRHWLADGRKAIVEKHSFAPGCYDQGK